MTRTALKLPPGLQSDDTTHAKAGYWADGSNVRFRLGFPQTIGGWEALTASTVTGACRWVFPWGTNDNQTYGAFGTHTNLYVYAGGGVYDITPTSGFTAGVIDGTGQSGYGTGPYGSGGYATPSTTDYFPLTWSGGATGEDLVASPRDQGIFLWDASVGTGTVAATLTNSPGNVQYCLVSAQDAVFALGCTQEGGSTFNALTVRHSGIGVPTEWNTAATTTSRQYVLPGGGRIVAGRVLADSVLVWTTSGLFRFDYLAQIDEVYRWSEVGRHCGLIGPGAAAVVGQTAYWISPDRQFWSYTLGAEPQIMDCPIREDFADNLSSAQYDKIVASTVGQYGEVWWDYPDSRDGYENSRYVAAAVAGPDAGVWFRGEMARTARVDAGPSPYPLAVSTTIDGTTATGMIYWHELGTSADGSAFSWFIESADQYMSEEKQLLARSFWPDAERQTGAVTLTLTTRERPNGTTRTTSYTIASDADKVDLRASGRLFRIKLAGNSAPSEFRLGRPVIDFAPMGTR